MSKTQVTQAQIIQALRETGGVISDAAKRLGLATAWGLRKRINSNQKLKDVLAEIREDTKDLAEGVVMTALKSGDKDIAKWYLAALARDRGYGNKQEIDLNGKLEIEQHDLSKLSSDELKQLEETLKKVTKPSAG